ncbi:MAG: SGNH/GDSL hydrolase family protein, partial [Oscillospiraceae bacterium]|nr:SGNH/GDSL hydrolase family protein [Oscillospiraceae bacterium]
MANKKVLFSGLAMVLTAGIVLAAYQRLVQPKYMSDVVEGNLIADYYNSGMDHDVLFVGDCECYEN